MIFELIKLIVPVRMIKKSVHFGDNKIYDYDTSDLCVPDASNTVIVLGKGSQ